MDDGLVVGVVAVLTVVLVVALVLLILVPGWVDTPFSGNPAAQ